MHLLIFTAFTIFTFVLLSSPFMMGVEAVGTSGGYSPADTESEEINYAAQLILQELEQGIGPSVSYSSKLQTNSNMKAVPLEASQQVVAGLNFRVKVGIFIKPSDNTKPECIGGISATVYRNLGKEYSVTKWGSEIGCDQMLAIMIKNKGEEWDQEEEWDQIKHGREMNRRQIQVIP